MTELSYHRDTCRLCGSADVECVVPLRPIPVATPNIELAAAAVPADRLRQHAVPLDLYLCNDCGHFQLLDIINPEVQYTNFRYTTSVSLGLPEHFRQMAGEVLSRVGDAGAGLVLEIGSNDGTLLRAFRERGARVLGVDPARRIAEQATASGIETIADFFTAGLARRIRDERMPAGIVICNNTFANIDALADLVDGIRTVLAPEGVFVFETSYGADVVRKTLIDTVYHEHLSYFLVRPLERFFREQGLELYDVEHIWTKGGSIRGYVQHAGGGRQRSDSVTRMVAAELAEGFDRAETFRGMAQRIEAMRLGVEGALDRYAAAGRPVVGYGASVGTVTLIHQLGLAHRLEAVLDDKPLADALVGPDCRIPILASDALYAINPALVLILAWRYAAPIVARHRRYVDGGGIFLSIMDLVDSPVSAGHHDDRSETTQ